MAYDFLEKEGQKPKDKKFVLGVIVLVAIGIVAAGTQITGQVTDSKSSVCSSFDECKKIAESATSSLQLCDQDSLELTESKQNLEITLNSCEKDRKYYTTSYVKQLADYRNLVKNIALEKCCTEDDVERGSVKSFGITANSITCHTEGYAVNCRTGGTTY